MSGWGIANGREVAYGNVCNINQMYLLHGDATCKGEMTSRREPRVGLRRMETPERTFAMERSNNGLAIP
jgi:hypothetical protein